MGLIESASTRERLVRNGLVVAAFLLVLAAGLFAMGAAREDAALHERYAGALELAARSLDAQGATARVRQSLLHFADRAAEAPAGASGEAEALLLKLADSVQALAGELAHLRAGDRQDGPSVEALARAEAATVQLLAIAAELRQAVAEGQPRQAKSRLMASAEAELETVSAALGEILALRRARIDDAARLEARADRIARISVFAAGTLGLALGLLLTLVAWRSLSTNARLLSQLTQMAREDGLTGVANRRTLDERLPQELARAARHGYPLTVVMIDLDHFKRFNDRRGHAAGDTLLRKSAQAWLQQLRPSDLLARYGGEEFTLVLPSCGEEQAERLVERLRPLMPEMQTFSAGIATWNGMDGPRELVAAADRALLQAKRNGRNRTVVSGREPQISLPLRLVS